MFWGLVFTICIGTIISYKGYVTCSNLASTGEYCGTCGMTRDFIQIIQFNTKQLINPRSLFVFWILLLKILWRGIAFRITLSPEYEKRIPMLDIVVSSIGMLLLIYLFSF